MSKCLYLGLSCRKNLKTNNLCCRSSIQYCSYFHLNLVLKNYEVHIHEIKTKINDRSDVGRGSSGVFDRHLRQRILTCIQKLSLVDRKQTNKTQLSKMGRGKKIGGTRGQFMQKTHSEQCLGGLNKSKECSVGAVSE